MIRIPIIKTYTHELIGNEKYIFGKRIAYNLKTKNSISMQYKKGSIGYSIDRKFITLEKLKPQLKKIEISNLPF